MMLLLEMGPNFQRTVSELGGMGQAIVDACSEGMAKGAEVAAGKVVSEFLSGQYLKRRTSRLAGAVEGWMVGPLEAVVGVRPNSAVEKYKWLLGDEPIPPITPKKGKFLAIPIGEALTGAGTLKGEYSGGLRSITDGFFVKTKTGRLLFGIKQGKRGKFRPLFTLVKSVLVQPTGALYDGVMDSLDDISEQMENEIAKKTEG